MPPKMLSGYENRKGHQQEEAVKKHPKCKEAISHSVLLEELAKQTTENGTRVGYGELHEVETILSNITHGGLSETDIWNVAHVIGRIEDPDKLNFKTVASITSIVNELLVLDAKDKDKDADGYNLRSMQQKAATSNVFLQSLDRLLLKAPLGSFKELVVKEKVTTLVLNTDGSNLTSIPRGIGVLKQKDMSFRDQNIVEIPYNSSLEWVIKQEFSAAVLLPESLLLTLSKNSHRLVFSIFWDSTLFGGTVFQHIFGHVVSVTIDGQHTELDEPIFLIFERQRQTLDSGTNITDKKICRFWNFEANNGNGEWATAGCTRAEYPDNKTDICVCTHLTHFGKLLYNVGNSEINMHQKTHILDIVTVVGCSLSLVGLAGVFLSATLFPGEGTGRRLQLQLCAAQAILMTAVLWDTAAVPHLEDAIFCLMRGLLLHWSVLALGIWSLAIALYQHRRLTQPLHALHTDPRFLPSATMLSWGCPVVVCGIVMLFDSHAYVPYSCYPSGVTLLLSVVVPLGSIVVTNSIIFLLIIWSICNCNPHSVALRDSQDDKTRIIRRVIASSYLFCLLGLCWLFGFLHLQYLFCVTASMQGVSHFIFCVVLDRATRRSWHLYKKQKQKRISSFKSWRSSLLLSPKAKQCSIEGIKT